MARVAKVVVAMLVILALGAGAGIWALTHGAFEIDPAALEAKYKLPTSQFAILDGIRVHYVDEGPRDGSVPTVVLLHASTFNLRTWDQMAAALLPKHRVVRLDFPGSGLTGSDPQDRYGLDLNVKMVEALMTSLGIDRFDVVGTSTGGTTAFRYAAAHKDHVTRLILINAAGMPRTTATDPNRPRGSALALWIQRYHKSLDYYRQDIARYFIQAPQPPGLAEMVYDTNRRQGRTHEAEVYRKNFTTGDPKTVLATVTAPTYILWGMDNLAVMHLEADVFQLWLTNAPSLVKKYPRSGHYPYLEIPRAVESDVAQFLAGDLDSQLRVTKRLTPQVAAQICADGGC